MLGSWLIKDNHIALSIGKEVLHPSADELYDVVLKKESSFIDGVECEDIEQAFQGIKFSKIGSDIRCRLSNSASDIALEVFCLRKGREIPVDIIDGQIVDQCITKDEWFYVTGSTKELEQILTEANIKESGRITIAQYIEITRNIETLLNGTIQNNVITSILDKPIDSNKNIPKDIHANLYKYQKIGFLWMRYMLEENGGCILGDEMGLGKTLQVITLMQDYHNRHDTPMLVVAPVSLLQNWKNECEKFAPDLNVLIHHGTKRSGRYKELENYDVIVISYNTAVSDTALLSMISWKLVVLDEAQNIKNPNSERTKFVKKLPRSRCIAVSGTPFENHVSDIWSIVDFVIPGLLGTQKEYNDYISDDLSGANKIEPILSSIMIRRMVLDVASDLPDKIVIPQPICMSEVESLRYEDFRNEAVGDGESIGLGALQKLRMYCTHPQICEEELDKDPYAVSIKYQRMCEILSEIRDRDEKVILFTSYQKMFDILENDIPRRFDIPVLKINGSTPVEERQGIVDKFNVHNGCMLLVLNPRAAGTGLNITSANHVIHYNLEWNPALEDQASARAYRRGQDKTVFVYRLYYQNTVEQIVNDRIERKRKIAEKAIVGTDGKQENREDIISALNISPLQIGR